jgi:hypothetical protein
MLAAVVELDHAVVLLPLSQVVADVRADVQRVPCRPGP